RTDSPARVYQHRPRYQRGHPRVPDDPPGFYAARMERITAIGGVFLRARDAEARCRWYAEHLGFEVGKCGGRRLDRSSGGSTTWAVFEAGTEYFSRLTSTSAGAAAGPAGGELVADAFAWL